MKLLTKEIERKLERHPIGSQDGKGGNADVLVKFFYPFGTGTWLVTEAERTPDGSDWLFYGFCDLGFPEWGYFYYSEIKSIRWMERDLYPPKRVVDEYPEHFKRLSELQEVM